MNKPPLNVPESIIPGLIEIIGYNRDQLDFLAERIKDLPIGTMQTDVEELVESIKFIVHKENVIKTIFGLGGIFIVDERPNTELVQELVLAIKRSHSIKVEDEKIAETLLLILNSSESLKISFKIFDLYDNNSNIIKDFRFFKDVRFVNMDKHNEELNNQVAALFHKLKFEYVDDEIDKEIYFTLKLDDLRKLKIALDEAIRSEESTVDILKDRITIVNLDFLQ